MHLNRTRVAITGTAQHEYCKHMISNNSHKWTMSIWVYMRSSVSFVPLLFLLYFHTIDVSLLVPVQLTFQKSNENGVLRVHVDAELLTPYCHQDTKHSSVWQPVALHCTKLVMYEKQSTTKSKCMSKIHPECSRPRKCISNWNIHTQTLSLWNITCTEHDKLCLWSHTKVLRTPK